MSRRTNRILLAALAIGVVAAVAAPVLAAEFSSEPAGEDGIGTTVRVALKSGTTATFSGTALGNPYKVTCTGSSFSMPINPTTAGSLGPAAVTDPTFTGCKDSYNDGVTITANHTNGHWTSTFVDGANDETTESTATDALKLVIPKAGATASSFVVAPGCTVTFSPNAATAITKPYNDVSTWTITGASIPDGQAGCPSLSSSFTLAATYVVSPGIHDVS